VWGMIKWLGRVRQDTLDESVWCRKMVVVELVRTILLRQLCSTDNFKQPANPLVCDWRSVKARAMSHQPGRAW
jgi:hypothetical protein